MSIQKNDFIELEYTGRTEGGVFDTTEKDLALRAGLAATKTVFGPMTVCVGQGHVLEGLDEALIGKDVGKEFKVKIEPERAFGKKNAKLVQLIPLRKFKEHNVAPFPGLQVNIDDKVGIIKTASGGRVLVDFNHPLSGKPVEYTAKVVRKVEDDAQKVKGLLQLVLGFPSHVQMNEGVVEARLPFELPKEVQGELSRKAKELIPNLKDLEFKVDKKEEALNSKTV